jgi:diguanylate cyclase (GGDEF)-like protein/PAS domain S-box-containing protein
MARNRVAEGCNQPDGGPTRPGAVARPGPSGPAAPESRTEQRYRALIEASASVVWRADTTGAIIEAWVFDRTARRHHFSFAGRGWLKALHPEDRDRVEMQWLAAVGAGKNISIDFRVRHRDGKHRWATARAIALRTPDGGTSEWIGTVTDIEEQKQSEQVLREREELLRLAVEGTGLGIWDMELPSRKTEWSAELKEMAGLPADVLIDDDVFYRLVHPDDRADVEEKICEAVGSMVFAPYNIAYRLHRADTGEERWWHEWSRLVTDTNGNPARLVGAIQDITDRKRAEIERQSSEKRWRLALEAGRMVAWEHEIASGITTCSDNAEELLGQGSGPFETFLERVHEADRDLVTAVMRNAAPGSHTSAAFRYRHPDGRQLFLESSAMLTDSDGGAPRIVGVTSDITERKAAESKLHHAANHDALTGLLNRAAFQAALDRAIEAARGTARTITLILVDVDHFKDINDTLGHDAGDSLLQVAGDRLRSAVGSAGVVARLGGDEFAVLVDSQDAEHAPDRLAYVLLEEIRKTFRHQGNLLTLTASLGLASFPSQASDSIELLKSADLALYSAKSCGRARVARFTTHMRNVVEQRIALADDVRRALAKNQFVPFYQPKVDLVSGAVVGFEALARWVHPTRGVLTPLAFGAVFEDAELSVAIGESMLTQMMDDMRQWLGRGVMFNRVALNLSSFDFSTPALADQLLGRLADGGIPSSCFEIEVTETVLLDGESRGVASTLERLHRNGVKISLDDFGTGYASLTHLKRFPVDELKIDRSFVRNIENDADDAAIVSAVISLARSLGLKVVAEGVETQGHVERLRAAGCHYGQGYLFAKAMAASRVPWFLRHANRALPGLPAQRTVKRSRLAV